MLVVNNTGQSFKIGSIIVERRSSQVVDDQAWLDEFDLNPSLRDSVNKNQIIPIFDGSVPVYPIAEPRHSFFKTLTASNTDRMQWTDNVLEIVHNLNSNIVAVTIYNQDQEICVYPYRVIDPNKIKISFPIEIVPIDGDWKIRIF